MNDPLAGVDFASMYTNVEMTLAFLRSLPDVDTAGGQPITFHMYWKQVRPFGRKQLLPIKSWIATQPLDHFKLYLWSDQDLSGHELLQPWRDHINFRVYDPIAEAKDTLLEGFHALASDDARVWVGGDLFRALILHKHGGVYVDMDSVYMRDFSLLFGDEFLYKWSWQPDMISSAVMYLRQRSPLSEELLRGILELPPGETSWGCVNNVRAYAKKPFRLLPCAFFNPEWVIKAGDWLHTPEGLRHVSQRDVDDIEGFQSHWASDMRFPGSFVWHWHNRWEAPVLPGCKFQRLETLTNQRLRERFPDAPETHFQ